MVVLRVPRGHLPHAGVVDRRGGESVFGEDLVPATRPRRRRRHVPLYEVARVGAVPPGRGGQAPSDDGDRGRGRDQDGPHDSAEVQGVRGPPAGEDGPRNRPDAPDRATREYRGPATRIPIRGAGATLDRHVLCRGHLELGPRAIRRRQEPTPPSTPRGGVRVPPTP